MHTKKLFIICLAVIQILSMGCNEPVHNIMSSLIYNHWIHSYEEDINEIQVFRHDGYRFPPSRGRERLIIKEDGEFLQINIDPTDRKKANIGSWKLIKEDQMEVYFENNSKQSFIIEFVEVNQDLIKIRKTFIQ